MNDIKSLRAMLYTLGNVTTKEVTKFAFMNKTADPVTKRRSQEIYDALSEKLNIYAWACGRYGQHMYSPELGNQYAQELKKRILEEYDLSFDYSIQCSCYIEKHNKTGQGQSAPPLFRARQIIG